jgi:hypothetical protein
MKPDFLKLTQKEINLACARMQAKQKPFPMKPWEKVVYYLLKLLIVVGFLVCCWLVYDLLHPTYKVQDPYKQSPK